MSLSVHARRQVQQHARELVARELPALESFERNVLGALTAYTAEGWRLLVRNDLLVGIGKTATAFFMGPSGVFAVLVCVQRPDEKLARAVLHHAQARLSEMHNASGQVIPSSAVHLVVILPGSGAKQVGHYGLYWQLSEKDLPKITQRDARHLSQRQIDIIADQLGNRLPEYVPLAVRRPERVEAPAGLVDTESLESDQLAAAQERPFDSWLTFLHPHQQAITGRNYSGPARISGPAGTGKTVVALHRLRYMARRSMGPLLFTTFARTLPPVHAKSFQRLAPELVDRVKFQNLHAWARDFLAVRRPDINVQSGPVDTAFSLAWRDHRDSLQEIEGFQYWQTEVDRVIKGRGIRSLQDYISKPRPGRVLPLDRHRKELVWQLYETYQRNLKKKDLHDYNDLISIALDELTRRPLDQPLAGVVVDEVQDITLNGLRLLNELGGDGPNRLLLVGDGQQQVYPGGWRLSEAGISIQGRGEVLRVNYRNRSEILRFAKGMDATNQVDDLDGDPGVALRDAESANEGGQVQSWRGSSEEFPGALERAAQALPVPRGNTALIVFSRKDMDRCMEVLRSAKIPRLSLEHYEGHSDDVLKVGTVYRAKGLDFQGVLVVRFESDDVEHTPSAQEQRELRQRQLLVSATRCRDYLWWGVVHAGRQDID